MKPKASLFFLILISGIFLTLVYHVYTKDNIVLWQNATQAEGVMKSFTFSKGMQGTIEINYQMQGLGLKGELDGFYNDYKFNKNVNLLVNNVRFAFLCS